MKIKKYLPILYTAGISTVLFGVLLYLRGFYPFGNGSVMLTDMYDECVPSLYRFYDIIKGSKNIFYEFQASGGLNLYTETINEICNPFNYLLLFWKRENIYLAVNVLLLIYLVTAACVVHVFLIRMWNESSKMNVMLSLCYAFSGYMAYNFQILRWMILTVIFPLFMLACIRLWNEKKGGMYAVFLAYQIVLSVQHGYMTVLFCLFSSGIWLWCMEDKEKRKQFCWNVGVYTVTGILLSLFVLFPTMVTLVNSARSGANASYFNVFIEHGLKDLFERMFQFCHPVLLGLFWGYVWKIFKKSIIIKFVQKPKVRFWLSINVFLWYTALVQPVNLLWHMGTYVCFPVRYGYMLVLAIMCLVKIWLIELGSADEVIKKINFTDIVKLFVTVILLIGAVALFKFNETEIVRGFWSLTISKNYIKETVIVVLILLMIFLATICSDGKTAISKTALLGVCAVCGFCYFNMIFLPESFRDTQELNYLQMNAEYEEIERNNLKDLLNREKHNPDYPRNASLINGKSSLSGYFPTAEANYQYVMGKLGYLTPWVSTIDVGGTKISEYYFNHVILMENRAADFHFEKRLPLENQQTLLNAMFPQKLNTEENIFQIIRGDEMYISESGATILEIESKSTIYIDVADLYGNMKIYVNGIEKKLPMENMQDDPHVLLCLGTFEGGKVNIEFFDKKDSKYPLEKMKIGLLNEEKWNQLVVEEIREIDASDIAINSQRLVCEMTIEGSFEEGVLVLPMNATAGWEVLVDKRVAEIQRIGECFIGITMEEGVHEIELSFVPPYYRIGIFLSLLGLILLIILECTKEKIELPNQVGVFAEVLFIIIISTAIMVIYVLPTIGLAIHMSKRVIHMMM